GLIQATHDSRRDGHMAIPLPAMWYSARRSPSSWAQRGGRRLAYRPRTIPSLSSSGTLMPVSDILGLDRTPEGYVDDALYNPTLTGHDSPVTGYLVHRLRDVESRSGQPHGPI